MKLISKKECKETQTIKTKFRRFIEVRKEREMGKGLSSGGVLDMLKLKYIRICVFCDGYLVFLRSMFTRNGLES